MQKDAVIFGAGRIGRGFMGEVFYDAGYTVTFVDSNRMLVEQINQRKEYTLFKALPDGLMTRKVEGVQALNSAQDSEISDLLALPGTIVAVALHTSAYDEAAQHLALAIARRAMECPDEPLDILFAANILNPASHMERLLDSMLGGAALTYLSNQVGLIDTVIIRMTTDPTPEMLAQDPLCSLNSGYSLLPMDATAFRGPLPEGGMFQPTDSIFAEEMRKIYTLNAAHAVMAYCGAICGCTTAAQAISHPNVRERVIGALNESAIGLCHEFAFSQEEMKQWTAGTFDMIENIHLASDPLSRLGSDSARKLAVDDRLVGPAVLCHNAGKHPENLIYAIACGYLYDISDDEGTEKTLQTVRRMGIVSALEVISGLDIKHPLQNAVLDAYYHAKDEQEEFL